MIKLGDKVRCKYTGFTGIAVAKTEFINGCVQYSVVAKWNGKTTRDEMEQGIDEDSLEVIKPKKKKKEKKESNGGPMRRAFRQRGF